VAVKKDYTSLLQKSLKEAAEIRRGEKATRATKKAPPES
jgi:hypothetical protein